MTECCSPFANVFFTGALFHPGFFTDSVSLDHAVSVKLPGTVAVLILRLVALFLVQKKKKKQVK